MLLLILTTLLAGAAPDTPDTPAAPVDPGDPTAPASPVPPSEAPAQAAQPPPGTQEPPTPSATHDGREIQAQPVENTVRPPPSNGFEGTICTKPSPCVAGEARALVGPADSNFGGGGMGIDLGTEIFDASEAALQSHMRLSLVGHVNGLGPAASTGGAPPRGELAGIGDFGLGVMSRAAFHSGFSPFGFVHPVAIEISSVGGGAVWAYQPQLEVGFLAHSAGLGTGVRLSLRGGADLFYANGPLARLANPGLSDSFSNWRADPMAAGGLLYDQRLTETFGLHLGGELWEVYDSLGAAGARQILRGQAWIFLRAGELITGPELTFTSVGQAPVGTGYAPALPETNVTWMFGI